MGGAYVTLLFFWGASIFKIREMSVARLALFTASAWWAVAGFLGTQGYRFLAYGELGHDLKHRSESILLRFSLWEWMLFAAVTTSFAILLALLPPED
jgi:fatty acid desaturase